MIVAEAWMAMIMGVMLVYGVIMLVGLRKRAKFKSSIDAGKHAGI